MASKHRSRSTAYSGTCCVRCAARLAHLEGPRRIWHATQANKVRPKCRILLDLYTIRAATEKSVSVPLAAGA